MRWSCRHASAEHLIVEVRDDAVYEWMDHSPEHPTVWSFDEVLDGAVDGMVRALFGDEVVAALHDEVRARRGA